MSILTLLCKRTAGSFERHRSAKNRTAGRGGGLLDASFHANVGQILIWADILNDDARKKIKKNDGEIYKAVGPILQVVRRCIEREPEERISAKALERSLEDDIESFAGLTILHCRRGPGIDRLDTAREEETPTPQPSQSQAIPVQEDQIEPATPQLLREDSWSKLRSNGLTTSTIPSPGPESSLSSLGSFNFDNARSATAVGGNQSRSAKSPSTSVWNNYHTNDSLIDPSLTLTPSSHQTVFTQDRSHRSSLSSEDMIDGTKDSFFLSDSRPTSIAPPPNIPLPAIPGTRNSP